jgi:NADPH2:quinone reductase
MRAIAITEFGGPEKLQPLDLPRPRPAKGEVLVRVVAAGVNPIDWKIREGLLREALPHAFPLVPGFDVTGVVEEFGEGASRFRKGDRVWACAWKPRVQWGTYAEYVAVPEAAAALMPSKLLFEEAAAFPLAALTAYQALTERSPKLDGASVLVLGASGGVGHFAVQLARRLGGRVLGSAGSANQSFVLDLGAAAAIDYTREDVGAAVQRHCPEGVDLALDAVGGATTALGLAALRPGGRLVTIAGDVDAAAAARRGVTARHLSMQPNGEQLGLFARMVDRGELRADVQKIYVLKQAAEAQRESARGHVRGKLVINL